MSCNVADNRAEVSRVAESATQQNNDDFANWMRSRLKEESLWSNEMYRVPLLRHIGKIYAQKKRAYEIFDDLKKDMDDDEDELDILYMVIQRLKQKIG